MVLARADSELSDSHFDGCHGIAATQISFKNLVFKTAQINIAVQQCNKLEILALLEFFETLSPVIGNGWYALDFDNL